MRIAMTDVESSQIHSIGHDAETSTLAIRFKNAKGEAKGLYHYKNFGADDFEALKAADSLGKHFGRFIKPQTEKYSVECIEKAPPAGDRPIAA